MEKPDWILGQLFLWVMVVAIVITGLAGVRRSGSMLTAQQAGIVGGRSAYGTSQGYAQAGSDLSVWWGIAPAQSGQAVQIVEDAGRRSLLVRIQGAMPTLFGGSADLGSGSFQRVEGFYTGPPAEFE